MNWKLWFWPWGVIRELAEGVAALDRRAQLLTRQNETLTRVNRERLAELRRIGLRRNAKGRLEKAVW